MKKFKFTLQTVHNVREMHEERESVVLSELRAAADQATARVRHFETLRNDAITEYTRRLHSGEQFSAIEMELNSNHFASLNRLQQEAQRVEDEKKRLCNLQIETVAAAMREVKVTDRLRAAQKVTHRLESARREQNSIDDMVSARYARQILNTK